ncbi:MAG: tetratricopeptide repeat protein, partial [Nannocystaceae bacterium]
LAAAHDGGLIHRDFKPDNVLIGRDGRVRVLDFGLARSDDEDPESEDNPLLEAMHLSASRTRNEFGVGKLGLTRTGALVGTPAYMSPEQHLGATTDHRSDQFSFCLTAYEALYGKRPFSGKTLTALAFNVIQGKVEPPSSQVAVPTKVRKAIYRGLKQSPDDRFPSMAELLAELDATTTQRRFGWLAIAAVCALVVGLIVGRAWLSREDPCTGARDHLAGIWDAPRKQAIQQAFAATGLPYADNVWNTVESSLDTYTDNWVDQHTAACEATRVRGEQSEELLDLRMMCLDRRRTDIRALTDVFSSADAKVVELATQGPASLPELAGCDDTEGLRAAIPPPSDKEAREQVRTLREQLATAKALDTAGRWDEGTAIARRVEITADALGYAPLQAEARLVLANLLQQTDEKKRAAEALYKAIEYASLGHDDATIARAWTELVFVVGMINSDLDQALWCGQAAQVALLRAGADPVTMAHLAINRSAVLNRKGDPDAALPEAKQALDTFVEHYGENHPQVHRALSNLGLIYEKQKKWDQADAVGERAIAVVTRISGADHPGIVALNNTLSHIAESRGNLDRALALAIASVNLAEKVLPGHTRLAQAYEQLANVYEKRGDITLAYAAYEKALAIYLLQQIKGPPVGSTYNNLAYLDLGQGKYADAERHFAKALTIFEEAFGETHPYTLTVVMNLAEVLLKQDKADQALKLQLRVYEHHSTLKSDDPRLAESLTQHGEILVATKDYEQAEKLLARAMAAHAQAPEDSPPDPLLHARTHLALARALEASKRSSKRITQLATIAKTSLKAVEEPPRDLVREATRLAGTGAK